MRPYQAVNVAWLENRTTSGQEEAEMATMNPLVQTVKSQVKPPGGGVLAARKSVGACEWV